MKTSAKFALSLTVITAGLMIFNGLTPTADANGNGAPASRTGSPGDGASCTSCHGGTAVVTVPGLITSTIPASGYVPGQTYTITASISVAGKTEYGFEISPQTATGTKKGTMVITSSTTTQLISTGKYITHKAAGISFPSGTATWSFNWIAPAAGSGNFTFYGAFNVTNNNNSDTGDAIKLSTLAVTENLSTGVEDEVAALEGQINVFPNPVTDKMYITNSADPYGMADVSVININGQLVKKISKTGFGSFVDLEELATGYYVLKIETEKGTAIKKIIKK